MKIISYDIFEYDTIQYNAIQYDTIRYNTIQYNTVKYIYIYIMYVCAIIHGHSLKHMFGGSRGVGDHIHVYIYTQAYMYIFTYIRLPYICMRYIIGSTYTLMYQHIYHL